MSWLYSLIAAGSIILVSLIGILFTSRRLDLWLEKNLTYLVAFSAGVFLIVSYNLAEEVWATTMSVSLAGLFIISGFILFLLFDQLIPEAHHHHEINEGGDSHSRRGARKMLIGDGLHNISDGVILVPAWLAGPVLGLLTTLGILIHEVIQEISEFFVLREAGYTVKQALIRNFLVSMTILIGVVGSLALTNIENLTTPLIGLAAGGFFYVVLIDLIPRAAIKDSKTNRLKSIIAFLAGLTIIMAVNSATIALGLDNG